VLTSPGALSGGKILPRVAPPMPQGMSDLLTLAISSIKDSSGINLELLGMVEREQPGILEHMRKQAGMTVLAGLFDALRRYRKDQGRLMLWYITNFLTDARLFKIAGGISEKTARLFLKNGMPPQQVQRMMQSDSAQYIPLIRDPDVTQYDVIVDDTPTSPNMKERTWAIIMQMMPYLQKSPLPPEAYIEFAKYSPLPETLVAKLGEITQNAMEQQQKQPNPAVLLAGAKAQSEVARAELLKAQTAETQMNTAMGTASAQAENFNNQVQLFEAQQKTEEVKARVESLRAKALLDISKASATQADAELQRALAVLQTLDTLASWNQTERQMEQQARAA
jgi:hypothetical protein